MTTIATIPGYLSAVVRTSQRTGSTPRRRGWPARFIYHTTEGLRFHDYPWPPQFTFAWVGRHGLPPGTYNLAKHHILPDDVDPIWRAAEGDTMRLQHCPVLKTGYALKGASSAGCETNHAGHTLQCEFITKATWGDDLEQWELDLVATAIAEQIQGLRNAAGDQTLIDPSNVLDFHGSESHGFGDPWELTCAEWAAFDGIAGHQHVPGQDHWDPGNVNHERLELLVTAKLEGAGDPIVVPPPVTPPGPWSVFPTLVLWDGWKRRTHLNDDVADMQALLANRGYKAAHTFDAACAADGLLGNGTLASLIAFNTDRGISPVDECGPATWQALHNQ